MVAELTAVAAVLVVLLAEWLHARRCRRVAFLAFGPSGKPRGWTAYAPAIRALAVALLSWGLVNLYVLGPRVLTVGKVPEGGYRQILIVLDVSPSMQLKDAGVTRRQTRAQRASELLTSMLERVRLDQVRMSVVAFYTGAKPVVVETSDLDVVKNILNDLPLDYAFDIGQTELMDGIHEAALLAKNWREGSATLILVSDGDTVPDSGMPGLPKSIGHVLVVGVGDARTGKFIDGHQSRQDSSILRQIAKRLGGVYHDGNEKHLPSAQLAALAKVLPLQKGSETGRREISLIAVAVGASLLTGLPLALALGGSRWQAGRRLTAPSGVAGDPGKTGKTGKNSSAPADSRAGFEPADASVASAESGSASASASELSAQSLKADN